jgi:hypothetical protein
VSGHSKRLACPECGAVKFARGMAAHRRVAHQVTPATRLDRAIRVDHAVAQALAEEGETLSQKLSGLTDVLRGVSDVVDQFREIQSKVAYLRSDSGGRFLAGTSRAAAALRAPAPAVTLRNPRVLNLDLPELG